MVRRDELTDAQFAMIEDLLPTIGKRGAVERPPHHPRRQLLAAPHRRPVARGPRRYGRWKGVYDRFRRWRKDRTIDRLLERLHLRLDEAGRIDHELRCIDATSIRASRSAAGARRQGPGR